MKGDLRTLMVPFPTGLMSTARAPAVMPARFAAELTNMLLLGDGAGTKRAGFSAFGAELAGEEITRLFAYRFAGQDQLVAAVASGKLYVLAEGVWTLLKSGLAAGQIYSATLFAGELVLCNGVDPVWRWNGATLSRVEAKVVDPSANLTFVNATSFTIESEAALYSVGSEVRAVLASGEVLALVNSVSESLGVVTVVLDTAVLDATLSAVAYTATPPPFGRIYAAHDRLWGFGEVGAARGDAARVYFTSGFNDPSAWFDAEGNLAHVNLSDKSGGLETLRGMAVKDGMTIFFLSRTTQLWVGSDPRASGDFAWSKTLPVGLVHGDLVAELPNDVLFVAPNGARTLSRALQTEQLDVGDVGGEIDPTWQALVRVLETGDPAALRVRAVRHEGQGWFAFGVGSTVAVLQVTSQGFGWVMFDGAFSEASALCEGLDGRVYAAKNGQVLRYDESLFTDAGELYTCRWVSPWLGNRAGKRWANAYVEVLCEAGVAQPLTLTRYWNDDPGNGVAFTFESTNAPDYWDDADWDMARWDNGRLISPLLRDAFVSQVARFAVENTSDGALTLFGLQLYGRHEK